MHFGEQDKDYERVLNEYIILAVIYDFAPPLPIFL